MNLFFLALVSALALASAVNFENPFKSRVLVLLDNQAILGTHSLFFEDLRQSGYELDFKPITTTNFKVKEYGEYLQDHLILFCTSEKDPRALSLNQMLEFFDSGRNVLIAGDIDSTKVFRQLFNNFGVDLDEIGSQAVDHFNMVSELDHRLFGTRNVILQESIFPNFSKPVLYRGAGLTLTNYENYQVYGILRGSETTYSKKFDYSQKTLNVGHQVVLAAAVQGRNNARAVLTGSLDLFSNELYKYKNYANREFAQHLVAWNFGETGLIRVGKIHHNMVGHTEQPHEYKILDELQYIVEFWTWSKSQKKWVPYVANDIMVEWVMLDPYLRIPLVRYKDALYGVQFQIPDKHGIFQFKVIYRKPLFSFIDIATKVPVRPLKHNEYPRYLLIAYPYYLGVFGTIGGFFVFAFFFLLDRETSPKTIA